MRVEQQNTNIVDVLKQSIGPEEPEQTAYAQKAALFFEKRVQEEEKTDASRSVNMKDATYLRPETEEKQTLAEEIEQDHILDAAGRKEQMVVLAGTTSPEDYARMQEEGFSVDQTASNTIVTETDKIKAQLAKAGVDISIFGDDLDMEELAEIVGSTELAVQLVRSLKEADLPCTEENVREAAEALQFAGALETPNDDAIRYMVENRMEPTIENLYKAENSGTYRAGSRETVDMAPFRGQVERVIREAGLPVKEQTIADSRWMLENEIPLQPEHLKYVEALREMAAPLDEDALLEDICTAIAEGKRPKDAVLLPEYTLQGQADNALAVVQGATDEDLNYLIDNRMDLTVQNLSYAIASRMQSSTEKTAESGTYTREGLELLTARRQLEEVRLAMSAEANYALLKKGIQIDTVPLERLVEQLKQVEDSYYENLLKGQGVEATTANVQVFRETTEKLEELRYVPAYVLGRSDINVATVEAVHAAGKDMQESFREANERYETLMTAPRADLGDSIQKAFQNVDDILEDLGMETTGKNERAVRILAYNQMEITPEHIAEIKAVDEEVQRTFRNLTPAAVTELIRRGINPLDMDFASLNQVTDEVREQQDDGAQSFGEFLWRLERNGAIREEERASYIGIYRLIHQVEASDGAVIGALVRQGADITMRNLMMAVRSERRSGKMDYTVDGTFELGEGNGYHGTSIISQIETAYQQNCIRDAADTVTPERLRQVMEQDPAWMEMTPEQFQEALAQTSEREEGEQAYVREQLAQFSQSAKAAQDIYAVLEKYDLPNTVANVLAAEAMARDRNGMFRRLFGAQDELTGQQEEVLAEYEHALSSPEEMQQAQQKLTELSEQIRREALESDTVTSLDVRELRMLGRQIAIGGRMARDEQYSVPVCIGGEVVNVSLKIVRGSEKKGFVDVSMEDERYGKIAASFQAKEHGITGLIVTDRQETQELLRTQGVAGGLGEEGEQAQSANVQLAYIDDLDLDHFSSGLFGVAATESQDADVNGEPYQVQTTRLYHIAEQFIRNLREAL